MELNIVLESIIEATEGLGIVWRPNIESIPISETETVERREVNGQVVAGDFGFFIRIVVPDEDTEMEPGAWADLIVNQLSSGINDLSIYMNNASVDIKNKSRELASWERKHIAIQRPTQFQEPSSKESRSESDS